MSWRLLFPVRRLCRVASGECKAIWQSPGTVLSAASLVYRLPSSWVGPKLPWKVLHAALHLLVFTLTVVGLVAVFQFHNHSKIAHLYSLHSWLGITTVILFACQVGALSLFLLSSYGHHGLWGWFHYPQLQVLFLSGCESWVPTLILFLLPITLLPVLLTLSSYLLC